MVEENVDLPPHRQLPDPALCVPRYPTRWRSAGCNWRGGRGVGLGKMKDSPAARFELRFVDAVGTNSRVLSRSEHDLHTVASSSFVIAQ